MAKTGRPSLRSPEVEASIVEQLADGIPLAEICRQEGMPRVSTVYDWMQADAELSGRITRARDDGFERIAVDALRIADEQQIGEIVTQKGDGTVETKRADMIEHRKFRVDARLKLLAKWAPERYGDRIKVDAKVESVESLPDDALDAEIARLSERIAKLERGEP